MFQMKNNSMRILLVEDEAMLAEYVREMLLIAGGDACFVHWASTLRECLDVLSREKFDLVLLDLNLPDSHELGTLERVLSTAPDIVVVILTGTDDETIAARAMQAGAQDYLLKGRIDSHQLLNSIRYAMERRRHLDTVLRQNEELKRAREELENAYDRLKQRQLQILQQEKMASIGQLAAGVAHEINNPIGFVMSNLNTLLRYTDKLAVFFQDINKDPSLVFDKARELKLNFILDDTRSLVMESLEGAERIRNIVMELRNFSRTDQKEQRMAQINEVLENTISIVWNELKYNSTLKKSYGDIPALLCYPQQLSQVFMNLLINASQAIKERGEIHICTWHEANSIFISIADTGCGIPHENLHRIFEPFFTTKEVGRGTGLGLSIVYDVIVQDHQGEVNVESEEGKGTVFTVRLPVSSGTGH